MYFAPLSSSVPRHGDHSPHGGKLCQMAGGDDATDIHDHTDIETHGGTQDSHEVHLYRLLRLLTVVLSTR